MFTPEQEEKMKEMFNKLAEPFDPQDIEWRAGSYSETNKKAMALAYMNARAVMKRLDEVVGPENWMDSYQPISGEGGKRGFLCTIHIRMGDEWVGKTDGADESDFEPIKGGLSDAFKRAANKWGIGRYLYGLDSEWVKAEKNGKFVKLLETPKLPLWAVPTSMQATYNNSKTTTKTAAPKKESQPKLTVNKETLEKALDMVIPADLAVPFAGKPLRDVVTDSSVGILVIRYLTGEIENKNGVYFKPLGKEEKALQEAAKTVLASL